MKIYSFEIEAGRKVDLLPECQSFMEELLASHSTDLQQRAYEFQAVVGLDARAVENIMPMDASCEDIEVDRNLSFLDGYVQEALKHGAQPYIPEDERSGPLSISDFRNQERQGTSGHSLRFEAYKLPQPSLPSRSPVSLSSSTQLVPVPEPIYYPDFHESVAPKPSTSDTGSSEIKLRLDGVQRKWGRPTYSSCELSTSDSDTHKNHSGVTQCDVPSSGSSKARDVSYDLRRQQEEINPDKQRLAASLFRGTSKSEKRHSSAGHRASRPNTHAADKSHVVKSATSDIGAIQATPPPPDLLDLAEPATTSSSAPRDPFKQLEGLLDLNQGPSAQDSGGDSTTMAPDVMSLYGETYLTGKSSNMENLLSTGSGDANLFSGVSNASNRNGHGTESAVTHPTQLSKGPSSKHSLEKDAQSRQIG